MSEIDSFKDPVSRKKLTQIENHQPRTPKSEKVGGHPIGQDGLPVTPKYMRGGEPEEQTFDDQTSDSTDEGVSETPTADWKGLVTDANNSEFVKTTESIEDILNRQKQERKEAEMKRKILDSK